ncbi:O-methyltransferase [Gracilibacillus kekensis]|uniref:tRNA 5-hydroxyuridine methyltransferase n=1 Tax=Gracilibacillus kekensis TaxID=1027249 RepID=A0A1M7P0T5_9BACI|nr:O-methyltransferase [Gracilibacillus kekensis]SHN10076.1 Predicted O-methyltransferase YrrM [Gracilibacillus kekensis]
MIEENILHYLDQITPSSDDWVNKIEAEAEENHVPIMDKQGILLLQQLIRLHQPDKILEIGTAIGYSALRMLEAKPEAQIVSVERDNEMYQRAIHNIHNQNKQGHIDVILGDALEVEDLIHDKGPYDLIFIDAAKGQYRHFFEKYQSTLTDSGCVVTDNVLFRGLVVHPSDAPKRLQNLTAKIDQYNQWLIEHPDYHTTILPVGDGVAISLKKKK